MKNKLLLIFFFILLINYKSYSNSNNNCKNIIVNLEKCMPYKCTADFFEDKKIEYEVFSSKENNKCKLLEKDLSGITVCEIENKELKIVEEYLQNILSYNNIKTNYEKLEKFRYQKCHFYNNGHDNIVKEDELLDTESIDKLNQEEELQQRQKKEHSITSIFFDNNTMSKLREVTQKSQHNTKNERLLSDISKVDFSSILPYNTKGYEPNDVILSLGSYPSPKDWRIWVNGKVFQSYQNLFVTDTTADKITFLWKSDTQEKSGLIKNKNANYLEFTLCKGEEFKLKK